MSSSDSSTISSYEDTTSSGAIPGPITHSHRTAQPHEPDTCCGVPVPSWLSSKLHHHSVHEHNVFSKCSAGAHTPATWGEAWVLFLLRLSGLVPLPPPYSNYISHTVFVVAMVCVGLLGLVPFILAYIANPNGVVNEPVLAVMCLGCGGGAVLMLFGVRESSQRMYLNAWAHADSRATLVNVTATADAIWLIVLIGGFFGELNWRESGLDGYFWACVFVSGPLMSIFPLPFMGMIACIYSTKKVCGARHVHHLLTSSLNRGSFDDQVALDVMRGVGSALAHLRAVEAVVAPVFLTTFAILIATLLAGVMILFSSLQDILDGEMDTLDMVRIVTSPLLAVFFIDVLLHAPASVSQSMKDSVVNLVYRATFPEGVTLKWGGQPNSVSSVMGAPPLNSIAVLLTYLQAVQPEAVFSISGIALTVGLCAKFWYGGMSFAAVVLRYLIFTP